MCYQGFATCSCGHTIVHETCCELAASVTFYMKAACPNYSITSTKYSRPCGSGRFYCKVTKEGHFYEQVYCLVEEAKVQLKQIDAWSAPLDFLAAKFTTSANRAGVSHTVRQRHPAYNQIFDRLQALEDQRWEITDLYMVALTVLQEGTKYYYARMVHASKGDGSAPPLLTLPASLRSKLPKELQVQWAALAGPSVAVPSALKEDIIDAAICDGQSQDDQTQQYLSEGYNTYATPKSRDQDKLQLLEDQHGSAMPPNSDVKGPLPVPTKARTARRTVEQDSTSQAQNKTGRRLGSMKKPNSPNEASIIRRSARVRDKKVSYAESEASTIHSREQSPEKSDGGNLSPPKSDISTSPEKTVIRRRAKLADLKNEARKATCNRRSPSNSSLSGLINEWNRRNIAVSNAPGHSQQVNTPRSSIPGASLQVNYDLPATNNHSAGSRMPTLAELLNHSPSAASLAVRDGNAAQDSTTVNGPRRPPTTPVHGNTNNSMGMPRLPGMTNYVPSTPGPVPVPSYQYDMYANRPMRMAARTTHYLGGPFRAPSTQPSVTANWTTISPAFGNPTELITAQKQSNQHLKTREPMDRDDSSLGIATIEETNNTTHSPFTGLIYDDLRRSFSSTTELTPPVNLESTIADTDPKKRSLPASSPLPSRKRLRLSFPGEDGMNGCESELPYSAAGSISSPSKMPVPDVAADLEEKRHPRNIFEEDLPTVPAPFMTPTAVMYLPTQQQSNDGGVDGVHAGTLEAVPLNRSNDEEVFAESAENLLSDIDWGLINDDFL